MTHHTASPFRAHLGAILLAGLTLPAVAAATGLTITPASAPSGYAGTVTLDVTGLPPGDTVVMEAFIDDDRGGDIDAGEPLVQRFMVTDGSVPVLAGVRNTNVPGDEDGLVNGTIRTVLGYHRVTEIQQISAQYIYRASSLMEAVAPTTAVFSIMPAASTARVSGRVTAGGAAVPFAFVFVLQPSGSGPLAGVVADASGRFTLNGTPGTYELIALRGGFLFGSPREVTLENGRTMTRDLTMIAADRTISGRVTDSATGVGIGGVQLFSANNLESSLEEGSLGALAFTDADGNFTIPVAASEVWGMDENRFAAALRGYLVREDPTYVDTSAGSVSGVALQWLAVSALVHGRVTDDGGAPVGGLEIDADDGMYYSATVTDADGAFVLGSRAGGWGIDLDSETLASRGYLSGGGYAEVAAGQAVEVNLVVRRVTAHLRGRATDDTGAALSDVYVYACADGCGEASTGADGAFDVGVASGTWYLGLDAQDLAARGLLSPTRPVTVAAGEVRGGLDLVARRATARIVASVRSATGAPLAGVGLRANTGGGDAGYFTNAETDPAGLSELGAFDATWFVEVSCDDLRGQGYECPDGQTVTVAGADRRAEFVARASACPGDCDGSGEVTVDDLIKMVNIANGSAAVTECVAGDTTGDGLITIEEIIAAVSRALSGC